MPLMFEPGSRWAYGGRLDRVGRIPQPLSRLDATLAYGMGVVAAYWLIATAFLA